MSYEYTISIVDHPKDENWFRAIQPLNSNFSDVISELWSLENEVDPMQHHVSGNRGFKVSGTMFLDYMELHRPDFLVDGSFGELIAAIKKSKSPDRVKLSIVVEHP